MNKKKLLAIDDEITILEILNFIFEKKYDVITSGNGLEGLQLLQSETNVDIIIADVNMPEMNGYDFIKQIRSSGLFRDIPLIMLSGNDNTNDKIKCLRLGADDYLVKPFNPEELDARIDNIFRRIN